MIFFWKTLHCFKKQLEKYGMFSSVNFINFVNVLEIFTKFLYDFTKELNHGWNLPNHKVCHDHVFGPIKSI
jgi:hypothetical protein